MDELAGLVGDREAVPAKRGWLPAEGRQLSLRLFAARRAVEVRQLRAYIPARQAQFARLAGRAERVALRGALSLEAMPPMQTADTCSNARTGPGTPQMSRPASAMCPFTGCRELVSAQGGERW